jgi:hypothetical protein
MVASTGDWGPIWGPEDVANSPFDLGELERVRSWLRGVYTPEVAKRVFRNREQPLQALLSDFLALSFSDLFSMGLDGIHADPPKPLIERLRDPHQLIGARTELSAMAAFNVAGIPFEREPLGDRIGCPSPDFFLPGIGDGLYLEAKHCGAGKNASDAARLAEWITCQDVYIENWIHRRTVVDFTEDGRSLMSNPPGVRVLRREAPELRAKARAALIRAKNDSGPFEVVIEDLVRVEVGERVESGFSGYFGVAVPDPDREADRIIKAHLEKGAAQLPGHSPGVVMIDVDSSMNPSRVGEAIRAWLTHPEHGALYDGLIGAILVWGYWPDDDPFVRFLRLCPIWKPAAPAVYRDRRFWDRLEVGMNWQRIHHWQWAYDRARREASQRDKGEMP